MYLTRRTQCCAGPRKREVRRSGGRRCSTATGASLLLTGRTTGSDNLALHRIGIRLSSQAMNQGFVWMVRAGEGGTYADEFESNGIVAIGWSDVGALPPDISDHDIETRFAKAYPTWKEGSRKSGVGQVRRFLRDVKIGDRVMTYSPERRLYLLGNVSSDVDWRQHTDLPRVRQVHWTHQVQRDVLSAGLRNSLGSTLTLFRLDADAAKELFEKALPLGTAVEKAPVTAVSAQSGDGGEAIFLADAEKRAQEFLEDRLAKLDWREMQQIVAGILRAMGYKTRVSADGPDRGVDIFASPDGLGLEEPRIFVEVKHRQAQMGTAEIRAFMGGRKPSDRCLYVSTGGFTREARYEAERSSMPLTLVTLPDLRTLLFEYYDRLDPEAKAIVPLRRVYLPVG